jgi:3-oxoadipate enol-lactonase/4-carboxymuconolactone decarboxylase
VPFAVSHDASIYWRADGDPARPPLLMCSSLGTDHALWDPVMPHLLPHFFVVRYDLRGHGASSAPSGDYSMDQLAADALAVADAAGLSQFHWCGVSIGGMTGMHVALAAPRRVLSLVLANTSAQMPREGFAQRIAAIKAGGMAAVADTVLARFFGPRLMSQSPAHWHSTRNTLLVLNPTGYMGCCAAIRDMQLGDRIQAITARTLVITGARDESTPPAMGRAIATAIAGATLLEWDTYHISSSIEPALFGNTLVEYCLTSANDKADMGLYTQGLERRRQVLGADYVEQRLSSATDLTRDFQRFITEYAWGAVWTRGVLPDDTRRLLVLTAAATGGRWEEYRLHLRAALDAGMEPIVIKEALIQLAIYAGVPAANTAFAIAQELMKERSAKDAANT